MLPIQSPHTIWYYYVLPELLLLQTPPASHQPPLQAPQLRQPSPLLPPSEIPPMVLPPPLPIPHQLAAERVAPVQALVFLPAGAVQRSLQQAHNGSRLNPTLYTHNYPHSLPNVLSH